MSFVTPVVRIAKGPNIRNVRIANDTNGAVVYFGHQFAGLFLLTVVPIAIGSGLPTTLRPFVPIFTAA